MLSDQRYQELHARARALHTKRRYRLWYWLVRSILAPIFRVYFRVAVNMPLEAIPSQGPVIIAANHASFSDSFFIALLTNRQMRWMGKQELFEKRWQGQLFVSLGAFPVRRGQSDDLALETAQTVLHQGGVLALFPEGTRNRETLGTPRRGMARLALETGATIVPVAVTGTANLRHGFVIKPGKVRIAVGQNMEVNQQTPTPGKADELTQQVWPRISTMWHHMQAHPRTTAGAVAGVLGSVGLAGVVRYLRRRR